MLARLFLELGHAVQPAQPRHAIENPGKLGMVGVLALVEDDVLLRVDAGGDQRGRDLAGGFAKLLRVLPLGDRMQVDHAIDAFIVVLQADPVADSAEIIAEMQVSGGLDARKDPVHGCGLRERL